jgi:hypothetical protein
LGHPAEHQGEGESHRQVEGARWSNDNEGCEESGGEAKRDHSRELSIHCESEEPDEEQAIPDLWKVSHPIARAARQPLAQDVGDGARDCRDEKA